MDGYVLILYRCFSLGGLLDCGDEREIWRGEGGYLVFI